MKTQYIDRLSNQQGREVCMIGSSPYIMIEMSLNYGGQSQHNINLDSSKNCVCKKKKKKNRTPLGVK